ncbi:MAG: hypothetical protein ABL962_08725 [Fimbriimonadaceae bacterium]
MAVASNGSVGVTFSQMLDYPNYFESRLYFLWFDPISGASRLHRLPDSHFAYLEADKFSQFVVLIPTREDGATFDARLGGGLIWDRELISGEEGYFGELALGPRGIVSAVGTKREVFNGPGYIEVFRQTGLRDIAFTSDSHVGGRTVNATLTFFGKSEFARTVLLSSSNTNLALPTNIVMPLGRLQVTVPCSLSRVTADQPATITA